MSWNENELQWFMIYYILAFFSITGAILVAISILRSKKYHTTFSSVVLCLHISLCINEITLLPYVFSGNQIICSIAEIIHYYTTLMNYFALFILVQAHMFNMLESYRKIMIPFLERYGLYIICILPMMTFFRFLDEHFYDVSYPWCSIHSSSLNPLYFFTYELWMWLILSSCLLEVIVSTYYIYRKGDSWIAWRYFCTIGFYMIIALGGFLPNAIIITVYNHEDDDGSFSLRLTSFLPFYISGILYTIIFFLDRDAIENFELYRDRNEGISDIQFNTSEILNAIEEVSKRNQEDEIEQEGFSASGKRSTSTLVSTSNNPLAHLHHLSHEGVALTSFGSRNTTV